MPPTLAAIHQALTSYLTNQELLLDEETTGVSGLREGFQAAFGTGQLHLTGVTSVDITSVDVRLSARTSFRTLSNVPVTVSLVVRGRKAHLTLHARLAPLWSTSRRNPAPPRDAAYPPELLGPALLRDLLTRVGEEDPRLVFTTFAHEDPDLHHTLEKGLNFVWIDPSGNVEAIGGPAVVEDSVLSSAIDLPASAAVGPLELAGMELLVAVPFENGAPPGASALGLAGRLRVGTAELDVEGRFLMPEGSLDLTGAFEGVSVSGPSVLARLSGIDDLTSQLPDGFRQLPGLKLLDLHVRCRPLTGEVDVVEARASTTRRWKLIDGRFEMKDVAVALRVRRPFKPSARELELTIAGTMKVAGATTHARAALPAFRASAELAPGETIALDRLLRDLAPSIHAVVASMPAVNVARLALSVSPADGSYAFGATLASDWELDLGVAPVSLREASFDVGVSGDSVQAEVRGLVRFAGCDFIAAASFPDAVLTASLYRDPVLPLEPVVESLFGPGALPPALRAIAIGGARIEAGLSSGQFLLEGRCLEVLRLALGPLEVDVREIGVTLQRRVVDGTPELTGVITGTFELAGASFAIVVDRYGDGWRLSARMQEGSAIDVAAILASFVPGVSLPAGMGTCPVEDAEIAIDLRAGSLSLTARTDRTLQLGPLGSVTAGTLALGITPAPGTPASRHWSVRAEGRLAMTNGFTIEGSLECYDDARGQGVAFQPSAVTPLMITLPVPPRQGQDVRVGLLFGPIAVTGTDAATRLDATLGVTFENLPALFDNVIADTITGAFAADGDGFRVTIDRLFEGIDFDLPPVPLSATEQIALGTMRLDLTDITFEFGDAVEVAAKLGVGLPVELNGVFGTRPDGQPKVEIFNTYDPASPDTTLVRLLITAGTEGVSVTLVDSPLAAISFTSEEDRTWCACDFGEYGAVRFMLPILSLDTATMSFRGAGAATVVRPLRLPLGLLKNLLAANSRSEAADLFPDAVELKSVNLLDADANLDVDLLVAHVEAVVGGGFQVPVPVSQALRALEDHFNRLPDRLRSYFNIVVPDAFRFDIAITPDGGITIDVRIDGEPLRLLLPAGQTPMLFGLELRGFSFGEVLSGQLFLVKADFRLDTFDIYSIGAAFLPADRVGFLADSRAVHYSLIVRNLTMLIVYHTQVPIPVPVFYDELGIEYLGIEDLEFQAHARFPQPALNPMEFIQLFGDLLRFASEPDFLLDPGKPLDNIDPSFAVGPTFVRLPGYLGGAQLGKRTDLAELSFYKLLAHLLNGIKTFSVDRLAQAIPLEHRVGTAQCDFMGLTFATAWLVTTPPEFTAGAWRELGLKPSEASAWLPLLPQAAAPGDAGLCVFLKGEGTTAGGVQTSSAFALSGSGASGAATGFRIDAAVVGLMHISVVGHVKIDTRAASPFQLGGACALTLLEDPVMAGEVRYDREGLALSGHADLFPSNPALTIGGRIAGRLSDAGFDLSGAVQCTIGSYFVLSGASARLTHEGVAVSGTYLGQTLHLELEKIPGGARFSGELSSVHAGTLLEIAGPRAGRGPRLTLDATGSVTPVVRIEGRVRMLDVQGRSTLTLSAAGYRFTLAGKVLGAFRASMEVETSTNLLQADAVRVRGEMQDDFHRALGREVGRSLEALADSASAAVAEAQRNVELARRALDALQRQIDRLTRQVERELQRAEDRARRDVQAARAAVEDFQEALASTRPQVEAVRDTAIAEMNAAQKKVDDLGRNIRKLRKEIASLNRQLADCLPYDLGTKAALGSQIALKTALRAALEVARAAANETLDLARAAADLATRTATQAIAVAQSRVTVATNALAAAQARLAAAQRARRRAAEDARVTALAATRHAKEAALAQARGALAAIERQYRSALALNRHIARHGTAGIFVVDSASFDAALAAVHGGRVAMTVRYRLMRGPQITLTAPFDFKSAAGSFGAIARDVAAAIG